MDSSLNTHKSSQRYVCRTGFVTKTDYMIAVGVGLGQHVNACHERGQVLRGEIEGATAAELRPTS